MDADMDDVHSRSSEYQTSDDNDDASSIHASDWDTPPHERDANEAGGFSHPATSTPSRRLPHNPVSPFAADSTDASDDNLPAPVSARTLRYNRRSRSRNSSSEPFTSEDVYEDDDVLYSVSPTPAPVSSAAGPSHSRRSPGLFVSENEAAFAVRGETTLGKPEDVLRTFDGMEAMKRARDIKANIETNIAVLYPRDKAISKREEPELDPEDQLIKTLRDDEKLGWAEIAERLNNERTERGEVDNITSTAVYSRFVRMSATIPIPMGEIGFHPKDYAHLRQAILSSNRGAMSKGKKRVKNYDNPKELEVNMRKPVSKKEEEELETPERSEQLMQAVAKVERNFWTLVTDEMERSTSRLYSPEALADRYHAI